MINSLKNKTLDVRILELLKKENGFSADDLGTYFYKDVIKYAIYSLVNIRMENSDLKKQVMDMDMSLLKKFHFDRQISKDDLLLLISNQRKDKEDELKSQLQSYHSRFYFIVANKINNVDLDSFHKNIKKATFGTIYNNNYMNLAFYFANFVLMSIGENLEVECNLLIEKLRGLENERDSLEFEVSVNNTVELRSRLVEIQDKIESIKKELLKKDSFKNMLFDTEKEELRESTDSKLKIKNNR